MKKITWQLVILVGCSLSMSAQAGTIYLCKAYSGGFFWASKHCNQHSALIERIANVPDSLPFDQQVALASQQRDAAAQANRTHTTTSQNITNQSSLNRQTECEALNAKIKNYDSMARQPQSGQMQDWIAAQRKAARDRQFQLRC